MLGQSTDIIEPVTWALALGYAYSMFMGQWCIGGFFARFAWRGLGGPISHRSVIWHSAAVGYVERTAFTTSWLLGRPEFIGIWLVLKVAGQWGRWQSGFTTADGYKMSGRAVFNTLLLGTGLSVIFGVAGGVIVRSAEDDRWRELAVALGAPLFLIGLLVLVAAEKFPLLLLGFKHPKDGD